MKKMITFILGLILLLSPLTLFSTEENQPDEMPPIYGGKTYEPKKTIEFPKIAKSSSEKLSTTGLEESNEFSKTKLRSKIEEVVDGALIMKLNIPQTLTLNTSPWPLEIERHLLPPVKNHTLESNK
ncbi:MAG: hypothetical protein ACKVQC_04930 [Elusimicrobiota bacterium]